MLVNEKGAMLYGESMPVVFLQESLSREERQALKNEFPHYAFVTECRGKAWENVEVLYGNHMTKADLGFARRLLWIHSPTSDIDSLPLEELHNQGNILLSANKGQNAANIAEFALAATLAFAKDLFAWKEGSKTHEPLWSCRGKLFLQIGLGEVGSAIVERIGPWGVKIWGVRKMRTFHPSCEKIFGPDDLHNVLPKADIISVAIPPGALSKPLLGERELALMRKGSILIILGSAEAVDLEALSAISNKFRGIFLDTPHAKVPHALITPAVASQPEATIHTDFPLFRRNLRAFLYGKVNSMKNLIPY